MEPTQLDRIEAKLDQLLASKAAPARAPSNPVAGDLSPAPDSDLDSQYGDFALKKDPPRWKGESFAGVKLSRTTPEYCDAVMSFALWKADKDRQSGDDKKAGYSRREAERALGWKLRLERGHKTASAPPPRDDFGPPPSDDDGIPF
jgi:hypothetical protein